MLSADVPRKSRLAAETEMVSRQRDGKVRLFATLKITDIRTLARVNSSMSSQRGPLICERR